MLLRTALETQLEVSVKNMIKLLIVNAESTYEIIESIIAYGSVVCLAAFALCITCFLNKNKDRLETRQFMEKFGSLI